MPRSFWKKALASLPPQVQRRYAAEFEAIERYEPLIGLVADAGGHARRALGNCCRRAAGALRAAARRLDTAGRRLSLS